MTCATCSCENDGRSDVCRACGARSIADSYEERIADAESRLVALTRHIAEVEAERAEIAASLARARRLTGPPQSAVERPAPVLDAGPFRATFGAARGTRVSLAGNPSAPVPPRRPAADDQWSCADARPEATRAVWEALDAGASAVRVDCAHGCGATTLLRNLAAEARDHGFPDGTFGLIDVRGPVTDITQRLVAAAYAPESARYYARAEVRRMFAGVRALVTLDRVILDAAEQATLVELFPTLRFVVVDSLALAGTPMIAVGDLAPEQALVLLEAGYGRRVAQTDLDAARAICETVSAWPGRVRLTGIAAAELRADFGTLQAQYGTGSAIVGAFISALGPLEQRVLAVLARVRSPLTADLIAKLTTVSDIERVLARLVDDELVRALDHDLFELPRYVKPLVPLSGGDENALRQMIDAVCDAFDPWYAAGVADLQLTAAEPIVQFAAERARAAEVLALGPRLAEMFAMRGWFGAWGRMLDLTATAARTAGSAPALDLARYEQGVRALLLGERSNAAAALRAVVRDRKRAGDIGGATQASAVLALAEHPLPPCAVPAAAGSPAAPVGSQQPAPTPGPETAQSADPVTALRAAPLPRDWQPRLPMWRPALSAAWGSALVALRRPAFAANWRPRRAALFGSAVIALVVLALWLWPRPPTVPEVTELTATPEVISAGSTAQLCVTATGAASVDLAPGVGSLPGDREHCLAIHPAQTTTYVAIARDAAGRQARRSLTVGVRETAAPPALTIAGFGANPARIRAGATTSLCYAVSGAALLRIVPRVGDLVRLRACERLTLTEPHRYTYRLLAIGENGQMAVREAHVDVVAAAPGATVAAATSTPRALPATAATTAAPSIPSPVAVATHPPTPVPAASAAADLATNGTATPIPEPAATPGGWLARKAVYQFDVTPGVIERGQAASLCVGVGRYARGDVTAIGPLVPGITRCFRVHPNATTAYRLHVSLDRSTAVETLVLGVQSAGRRPDVARSQHR